VLRDVLLRDATSESLGSISVARAVGLVLDGRADLVEADPQGREVRSPTTTVPRPAVVQLRAPSARRRRHLAPVDSSAVLLRDGYECAYCTDNWADTVDHVVPRSRGGRHEWRNVVAACRQCNEDKGDRLLAELGWRLRFQPTVPRAA
jgi:5-methylcytosine-specific restriction endonuclease McrA